MNGIPIEVLKLNIWQYLTPNEIKEIGSSCKIWNCTVEEDPHVWKAQFVRKWHKCNNFQLLPHIPLTIEKQFAAIMNNESACYRKLTDYVLALPSFLNVPVTEKSRIYNNSDYNLQIVEDELSRVDKPLAVTYAGPRLGGDRCVQTNVPFPVRPHTSVICVYNDTLKRLEYQLGITYSGYFEVRIESRAPHQSNARNNRYSTRSYLRECVAIGASTSKFKVFGRQPGWDRNSYGYHGDDGHFFHSNTFGEVFGPQFGAGDVVGCGIVRHASDYTSMLYFTKNGQLIGTSPCEHTDLFPTIGIDAHWTVKFNFGQFPFFYDSHIQNGQGMFYEVQSILNPSRCSIDKLKEFVFGSELIHLMDFIPSTP